MKENYKYQLYYFLKPFKDNFNVKIWAESDPSYEFRSGQIPKEPVPYESATLFIGRYRILYNVGEIETEDKNNMRN